MFFALTQSGVRRLNGERTTKLDLVVLVGEHSNRITKRQEWPNGG